MFKYLLVREDSRLNQVYLTLQEARNAQREVSDKECSGIVRVSVPACQVLGETKLVMYFGSSDDTGFVLLSIL